MVNETENDKENDKDKVKKSSTDWINCNINVAKDETDYRRAIHKNLMETDKVLELGCHVGVTTDQIATKVALSVGVDSSSYSISEAKRRFGHVENLHFLCLDACDKSEVLNSMKNIFPDDEFIKFDVICIDVSGNRQPGFVLDLLEGYDRIYSPRIFIIKNFKLQNFVKQCSEYEHF